MHCASLRHTARLHLLAPALFPLPAELQHVTVHQALARASSHWQHSYNLPDLQPPVAQAGQNGAAPSLSRKHDTRRSVATCASAEAEATQACKETHPRASQADALRTAELACAAAEAAERAVADAQAALAHAQDAHDKAAAARQAMQAACLSSAENALTAAQQQAEAAVSVRTCSVRVPHMPCVMCTCDLDGRHASSPQSPQNGFDSTICSQICAANSLTSALQSLHSSSASRHNLLSDARDTLLQERTRELSQAEKKAKRLSTQAEAVCCAAEESSLHVNKQGRATETQNATRQGSGGQAADNAAAEDSDLFAPAVTLRHLSEVAIAPQRGSADVFQISVNDGSHAEAAPPTTHLQQDLQLVQAGSSLLCADADVAGAQAEMLVRNPAFAAKLSTVRHNLAAATGTTAAICDIPEWFDSTAQAACQHSGAADGQLACEAHQRTLSPTWARIGPVNASAPFPPPPSVSWRDTSLRFLGTGCSEPSKYRGSSGILLQVLTPVKLELGCYCFVRFVVAASMPTSPRLMPSRVWSYEHATCDRGGALALNALHACGHRRLC